MESTDSRLTLPGTESELDMIPFIWQRLPADILEIVLTKLPLSALRKFSGVSKSWMAFIHSEEFAHRCQSSEPTVFYFCDRLHSESIHLDPFIAVPSLEADSPSESIHLDPFIAVPSLEADSWEKYFLEFIAKDEIVDLLGTSEGLLCYSVRKMMTAKDTYLPNKEVFLVVHNPFTRKWRRFVVPYTFTLNGMLGGLAVDQDTGNYKVVLASIEGHSPRTTYIYDSRANSWSVSATLTPALSAHPMNGSKSISIFCDGELYWFVQDCSWDYYRDPTIKTLIKYSIDLDTWFTATLDLKQSRLANKLRLTSFQKRPVIVNLCEEGNGVFPEEFPGSGWNLRLFDAEDIVRLLQAADHEGESNKGELRRGLRYMGNNRRITAALAECDTWFIFLYESQFVRNLCVKLEASSVTQLPETARYVMDPIALEHIILGTLGVFAARLNAFV